MLPIKPPLHQMTCLLPRDLKDAIKSAKTHEYPEDTASQNLQYAMKTIQNPESGARYFNQWVDKMHVPKQFPLFATPSENPGPSNDTEDGCTTPDTRPTTRRGSLDIYKTPLKKRKLENGGEIIHAHMVPVLTNKFQSKNPNHLKNGDVSPAILKTIARLDFACQDILTHVCKARKHQHSVKLNSNDITNNKDEKLTQECIAAAIVRSKLQHEQYKFTVLIAGNFERGLNNKKEDLPVQLPSGRPNTRGNNDLLNAITASLLNRRVFGDNPFGGGSVNEARPVKKGDNKNRNIEIKFLPPHLMHAEMQILNALCFDMDIKIGNKNNPGDEGNEAVGELWSFGVSKACCVSCAPFITKTLETLKVESTLPGRIDHNGEPRKLLYHTVSTNNPVIAPGFEGIDVKEIDAYASEGRQFSRNRNTMKNLIQDYAKKLNNKIATSSGWATVVKK